MQVMNQYFTNQICEWLNKSIDKTDFFDLLPIFEGKEHNLKNKKKDYAKIISNVLPPPESILANKENEMNSSPLMNFIQSLFDNNFRNNIFIYFLRFLTKDEVNYFLIKNIQLSKISESDLNSILPNLPFCDYVVILHCKRLQFQSSFLISIAFLIRYFEQLSSEMQKFVSRSFHQALFKGIGSNFLHEMLSILFATEVGFKTFNFFFTTIQESPSILLNYIKTCDLNQLFASFPERDDLPLSLLNFLVNTMTFYFLPESLIIRYVIECSELFFRYVFQISDEDELNRIWKFLLNSIEYISSLSSASIAFSNRKKSDLIKSGWNYILNLSDSMRIQIVHNILHVFLFFIERFRSLSLLCNERSFKSWLLSFISLNIENICQIDNYLAVMVNIFLIARSNELISVLISDNLSLNDYFLRILLNSFDFEKSQFTTKFVNAMLFILFPFNNNIFDEIFPQVSNFIVLSFNSSPCNTFCKQIAASIFSILFDIKNIDSIELIKNDEKIKINRLIFNDIMKFLVEMSNRLQFQKVCSFLFDDEEFLMNVAKLIFNENNKINELYYNFIVSCLSFSCNFSVFYFIYSRIESDIEKTINFLRKIAEKTPIVNSFIYPTEPFEIKLPLLQMTTVLWFRIMSSQMTINSVFTNSNDESKKMIENKENSSSVLCQFPTKILSIQITNPTENTYTLMLNREILYVIDESTKKIAGKVQCTSNIANWNLLTIGIYYKTIEITFNLQQIIIELSSSISSADCMKIHPLYDIQLLKIYKKILNRSQILHIFSIGPNSKDFLIDEFASISNHLPAIIYPSASSNNYSTSMNNSCHLFSNQGYISTLYINFREYFDNDNDNYLNSFQSTIHFTISPPYEIIKSGRDKIEIDRKNVWAFNTFFNSLDSIGGINLIIHLVAEVFVKHQKYQNETLIFLSILLNKFPFIHDFFVENSIYDLLACLVDSHLNFQTLFLYDKKIITNSKIIQCFLSKNKPSQSVIQDLVRSFNYSSGIHNKKFLNTTKLYNMIIMTLKDFKNLEIIEMLCEFASKSTVKSNLNEHSIFAFICLLYNHFNYDTFINDQFISKSKKHDFNINKNSTIHLLRTCSKLLPNQSIHVEVLIPILLNNDLIDEVKFEILDLLLNNVSINFYEYLSFAIQNMKCDTQKMYEYAIKCSPMIATFLFPFFMVQASKEEEENIELTPSYKYLETLCNKISPISKEFKIEIIHQYFLLIQCSSSPLFFLSSKKRENKSILMYVVVFIVDSFSNNQDENTNKLLINFFYLIQYLHFENDKTNNDEESYSKSITFSLLATLFFSLRSTDYQINSSTNILFGLSFGEFVLSQLNVFSKYANFFVKEMFKFILKACNTNDSQENFQPVFNQISKFISFLNSKPKFVFNEKMKKYILKVDELTKKKRRNSFINMFFSGYSNSSNNYNESSEQSNSKTRTFIFQRNKYYVKSPINALPSTIPSVSINCIRKSSFSYFQNNKKADELENDDNENINDNENLNWSEFIEFCLLYYNTMKSDVIDQYFEEELYDKIDDTLKNVFYSLQIPSSHIYDLCPKKYTVSDSSNKIEIRRLLFPINPSFDPCYLIYWDTKYMKEAPKIRLTMNEILKPGMISISQTIKDSKMFRAVWMYRISMIKGYIIVTDQRIKFFNKKLDKILITFSIDNLKNIRLMFHQHEKKGILIEDNCFRNYSFAFKTDSDCDDFINLVSNRIKISQSYDIDKLDEKQKKWISNEISNFEYLIYLNKFSGRTWCDFTQYPFFPWILTKYNSSRKDDSKNQEESKLNLHDLSIYRDLEYQLFAQSDAHRKCCKEYYEVTSEMSEGPSHFPNYVSNIGSTIYYLVRLEPFITEEILFQSGRYDSPDRMFQSFDITAQIMLGINTKSSLEFVPEIYYLPEMYKNVNNLIFPKSNIDESLDLQNFCLPNWAKSPEELVYKLRKSLESPYVSYFLHEWINLIWGVKRTGDLAYKSTNVFPNIVFKFDKDSCNGDKVLIRGMLSEIHNCGTAPEQLFYELHPQRSVPIVSSSTSLNNDQSKESSSNKNAKPIAYSKSSPLIQYNNESEKITRHSSFYQSETDKQSKQNFDINAHFAFFEQRESRLKFNEIRPPMAKESYSLKFDKDWLVIPPVYKIRISKKGILEILRRNSTAPALKFRFGQSLTPTFISKSGSEFVTGHKTPLIVHWCLFSGNSVLTKSSSMTKSSQKVSFSPSAAVLTTVSSSSSFSLNLSAAASSSSLANSNRKSNLIPNSGSASSIPNSPKSPKKVTLENESHFNGESCLKLVKILRGYSVAISSVFISTASSVILAGHEDGCVSVFSTSPHRFLRLIEMKSSIEKVRLKFPVTMVRTANWNSDIIVFQEREFDCKNEGNIDVITAVSTDKIELDQKKGTSENTSMMNKLISKFQRTKNEEKTVNNKVQQSIDSIKEKEIVTVISLYSVNGQFLHQIHLNHVVKECCGTSYPYATKKNYFALLTSDNKIVLLNGKNLKVTQVYDISTCPAAVSITYNKINDNLILSTKTKEVIDFNFVPFSSKKK